MRDFVHNFAGIGNRYIETPESCPICHNYCVPTKTWVGPFDKNYLITVWRCPNKDCLRYFIAENHFSADSFFIKRYLNGLPKKVDWPEGIKLLESGFIEEEKSKFIKIYNQAAEAESVGLDEVAGMGYRKAIEHLVKDLAVKFHPENKEKIRVDLLGNVIKENFEGNLKLLLERAAWLGNDQAHYFKLFEEYDLDKLKKLILVITTQLEQEHALEEYLSIEGRKHEKKS